MKYLFLLIVISACCASKTQKIIYEKNIDNDYFMDNLKWKMYSLSYGITLRKMVDAGSNYRVIQDSIFKPIECELTVSKLAKNDTIEYYFEFHRLNTEDRYKQPENSYIGIGYIKKLDVYFPIHGASGFEVPITFYKTFFENQEQEFSAYLNKYKGYISPWLKNEAIKRGVIK